MEMKMLRWMAGITRLYCICNQDIHFGVAPITYKLRKARLRWHDHALRADNDSVCKIGFNLGVIHKRPKERHKQRWMDTLHTDSKQLVCSMVGQNGVKESVKQIPPANGTNSGEQEIHLT
ncbi:hypothetical protein Y032_0048g1714 [Ancylostoma ceylanicum]|nr:hypothetical protein Y032_0048g1714 [Ancylostoma ceylanicum]